MIALGLNLKPFGCQSNCSFNITNKELYNESKCINCEANDCYKLLQGQYLVFMLNYFYEF